MSKISIATCCFSAGYFLSTVSDPSPDLTAHLPAYMAVPTTGGTGALPWNFAHVINSSSDLRPCNLAVVNHVPYHWETLESVAGLFPVLSMDLPASCDHDNLIFDFQVDTANKKHYSSWRSYFDKFLHGMNARTRRPNEVRVYNRTRVFGNVNVANPPRYDATIDASCYCVNGTIHWMNSGPGRACVFHVRCDKLFGNPRAVWLAPHHDNHYIPSLLPPVKLSRKPNSTAPHILCAVGKTVRRNFGLLKTFLDSPEGDAAKGRFTIHILGIGSFPEALNQYKNISTQETIFDFYDFHQAVAKCDALLMLLTKKKKDYFFSRGSRLKLSGTFPLTIAYKLPYFVHGELHELYAHDLPPGVPFATHSDDPETFRQAMPKFLDQLDAYYQ